MARAGMQTDPTRRRQRERSPSRQEPGFARCPIAGRGTRRCRPRPSPRSFAAPLRRRRPVALTAATAPHVPGHRRRVSTHPTTDRGPTRLRILNLNPPIADHLGHLFCRIAQVSRPSSGGDEDHPEPVNPAGWGTHRKCLPICTGSRLCSQLFAQVRESPGGPPALEPNPHRWIQAQPARGRSPRVRATPAARLACWYLHRLVLVLAPVIMTGTVHRPMELVLPSAALPGHRPRRPDTGSVAGTVTGSVGRTVAGERRNGSFCADRQGGHVHRGRRDGGGAERRCWFWGSRALRTSAGARSLLMAG